MGEDSYDRNEDENGNENRDEDNHYDKADEEGKNDNVDEMVSIMWTRKKITVREVSSKIRFQERMRKMVLTM